MEQASCVACSKGFCEKSILLRCRDDESATCGFLRKLVDDCRGMSMIAGVRLGGVDEDA